MFVSEQGGSVMKQLFTHSFYSLIPFIHSFTQLLISTTQAAQRGVSAFRPRRHKGRDEPLTFEGRYFWSR